MDREELAACKQVRMSNNARLASEGFYTLHDGYHYPDIIRSIKDSYTTKKYHFATIEQASAFFYPFVENYIQPFNTEKRIRPYLHNFPMTASNLDLSVLFLKDEEHPLEKPYIAAIRMVQGEIFYYTYDKSQGKFTLILKEAFNPANINYMSTQN